MSYLLDTNAISEPGRQAPNQAFMAWYRSVDDRDLFLSAVTLGELRRGMTLLVSGSRRNALAGLYAALIRRFFEQILPVDIRVAEIWGDL